MGKIVGNPSVVKENFTVRTATNSDLKPIATQGGGIIFEGQVISPTIMIIMPITTMTMTLMERVNLSHPIGIVQKLIESRVRFRQTDKKIVKVVLKSLFAHRLTTIEVIPQS